MLFLVLTSLTSFAQESKPVKFVSNSSIRGLYNKTYNKWDYKNIEESELTFLFYSDYITVNDMAHSIYRIVDSLPLASEEVKYSVRCIDENNKKCVVSLVRTSDDDFFVIILYPNVVSFSYHLN